MNQKLSPQNQKVLSRLQQGGWLTMIEAANNLFIHRLSQRVIELRAVGYNIQSERVPHKTYQRYRLAEFDPIRQEEARTRVEAINRLQVYKTSRDTQVKLL